MTPASAPIVKDLVLVGGGHAHVAVLKRFGMNPLPGARITVVTRELHAPYSGMLPGLVAGHYTFDEAHIDVGPLARFAGARLYHAQAKGIDTQRREVICAGRPPVPYDLLSLDIGATPRVDGVPGARNSVTPVKPIDAFYARWLKIAERIATARGRFRLVIVGGGAGGVELSLAIRHRTDRLLAETGAQDRPDIVLVTGASGILPQFNSGARARFERILPEHDIRLVSGRAVTEVAESMVVLDDGERIAAEDILWTTEAGAAPWLAETGLALDARGFVRVDDRLRSISHPDIFAAGDIAALEGRDLPKSGVFAVREGPVLAGNLRRALTGGTLRRYRPQAKFLSLISTGSPYAVAIRGNGSMEGAWLWRLKDWIDRRWMRQYNELPEMRTAEPSRAPLVGEAEAPSAGMRCAGCGAKVGSPILERALKALKPQARPGVVIGLDAPDDAAVIEAPPGKLIVQSVDYFPAFVDDPYVFGQIAANHALGDLFAMGAEPHSALALATLPFAAEAKMEQDLRLLLTGATEVLQAAGAVLIGGHTSEGEKLALGFAVTGFVDPAKMLRKGGMQPGDRLILTTPIGTGALLAADAQGKAKARWVDAALVAMRQSNRAGAECLASHGATALTDVTGFGLVGHLLEMASASAMDVTLDIGAVPFLEGACETVERGIVSSLQIQNVKAARAIKNLENAEASPAFPLLFDPQTSGGLLASVPAASAEACLSALKTLGYADAAIIGGVAGLQTGPESTITIEALSRKPKPCQTPNPTASTP